MADLKLSKFQLWALCLLYPDRDGNKSTKSINDFVIGTCDAAVKDMTVHKMKVQLSELEQLECIRHERSSINDDTPLFITTSGTLIFRQVIAKINDEVNQDDKISNIIKNSGVDGFNPFDIFKVVGFGIVKILPVWELFTYVVDKFDFQI